MSKLNRNEHLSNRAFDVVWRKLYENNGTVSISLYRGDLCRVFMSDDGKTFFSDKVKSGNCDIKYSFELFDAIVEFLKKAPAHKAEKGSARGRDKVGYGKCSSDTVAYAVAIALGKQHGDSLTDPLSVLAAVLDWAGIAHNQYKYLQLIPNSCD